MAKTPKEEKLSAIAFSLILSGAVGNLIDRVLFGYVIDFLDFHWGGYHFAAFNIADSSIFIGAALMILESFIHKDSKKELSKSNNNKNSSEDKSTTTKAKS